MPRIFDRRRHGAEIMDTVSKLVSLADAIDINPAAFGKPCIAGVEITQAIQYHRAREHLSDAADRADNSMMLVANKRAYVRVYLRSGMLGFDETVTGEVEVERRSGPLHTTWTPVATLTAAGAASLTTQVNPAYTVERSSLASTLNFLVPAAAVRGVLRFTARVWRTGTTRDSCLTSGRKSLMRPRCRH